MKEHLVESISFRCTVTERDKVQEYAARNNVCMSDIIRFLIRTSMPRTILVKNPQGFIDAKNL